ncbi:unnamed protein product [Protopolystoma xenopodis]|uniref:Uncharacterized protein n=1 Tax=Protopolystoma xenopodis TaxID=117903 RepID=A0A3S5AJK7_9PLAT|nr:unnamed protein product [Protopolystoma xenopodis]
MPSLVSLLNDDGIHAVCATPDTVPGQRSAAGRKCAMGAECGVLLVEDKFKPTLCIKRSQHPDDLPTCHQTVA